MFGNVLILYKMCENPDTLSLCDTQKYVPNEDTYEAKIHMLTVWAGLIVRMHGQRKGYRYRDDRHQV